MIAAPAAAAPQDKAPSKAEIDAAQKTLGVIVSGLQSDKVPANVKSAIWCQEEPMNQGAWYSSQHHMRRVVDRVYPDVYLSYAGRDGSAAAAAGYMSLHIMQQEQLVHAALYGTGEE